MCRQTTGKTLLSVAISAAVALGCASAAYADDGASVSDGPAATLEAVTIIEAAGEGELALQDDADAASQDGQHDAAGADDAKSDAVPKPETGQGDSANQGQEAESKPSDDGSNAGSTESSEQKPQPVDISTATVAVADQSYTSHELKPAATVKLGSETLLPDVDYTIAYADNKEVGTATATVTGIGKYAGTATGTFAIGHAADLAKFTDLDKDAWYMSEQTGTLEGKKTLYLDTTVARGTMLGYQDATGARTKFGPDDPVTRGQVVTMLYRLSHPDAADTTDAKAVAAARNGSGLPDVADARFYTAAVSWAVEAGVVSGYRDSVDRYYAFGADDPVTREQLAAMVGRFCVGYLGMPMATANIGAFADYSYIHPYARAGVQYCVANRIMTGYSGSHLFGPGDQATRSQMAKVMAMLVTLTDADAGIAANGWPTECEWHGGSGFAAPEPSSWKHEGGSWYYRKADGTNTTGMVEINGNKVHFGDDGKMTTGWFDSPDGSKFYFADNGIAAKGWEFLGDRWHYFNEKTAAFVKKSLTRDDALDKYIDGILATHRTLRAAYDYVSRLSYIKGNEHTGGHYLDDATTVAYARQMVENGGGNCYRFASLLSWLARGLGYESYVVAGWVDRYGGGKAPHGWTEIVENGKAYVCDADMNNAVSYRDWYMRPYGNTPIAYHSW